MQQTATLNEKEIYDAIYEYASKQVNFLGMSHKTEVIAGRGERGLYAVITLEPKNIKDGSKQEKVPNIVTEVRSIQDGIDEDVLVEIESEINDDTAVFG